MSEEQGCKKCKQKNTNLKQWATGALGFRVLGTSIYGTIVLVRHLTEYLRQVFGI